jgi:hypothetical protein
MEGEFDYLKMDVADKNVLKNLSNMGEHLKELKFAMLKAEAEYAERKKEYEYYSSSVLPMEMFSAGVTELTLLSGGTMSYKRNFYCQPNKNATDREIMAKWLREHGGDDLIKEKASVDGAQLHKLKEAGIPYTEIDDINTNSLKAFLKAKLGASGGIAEIQITDIPACIHFQEAGTVDIAI